MIDIRFLVRTLEIFNHHFNTCVAVRDNKLIIPLPEYSIIPGDRLSELVRVGWRFDPEIGWILEDKT